MLGDDGDFVPCLHSLGMPLADGQEDVPWPCDADNKYIVHFPETREIWSYGSGYGGNALLGKKCFALRIASAMARDEGWLAEHMLILKLTSPAGEVKYVAGAFPSASGKTNLAMLIPTLEGWTAETIGDDIAWMKFGEDGRLYAVNPEAGFFGVAPNTSHKTNPNAMETIERNSIFTNCARTDDGDVWWEGMTGEPPDHAIDWHGNDWTPDSDEPAAHPNARFTTPAAAVPLDRPRVGGPGRGADRRLPVRRPAGDHGAAGHRGVRLGARRLPRRHDVGRDDRGSSGRGRQAPLRPDGDAAVLRLQHGRLLRPLAGWRASTPAQMPRIFLVNWFRKDDDGSFIWPGFGENSRVLEWIFRRCDGEGETVETPIGLVPAEGQLNTDGLDISADDDGGAPAGRPRAAPRAAPAGRGAPGAVRRPPAGRGRRRSSRRSSGGSDSRGSFRASYASASSGSFFASISARVTITLHCFQVASSCILPSIMWTPRPSGIASSTFLANLTSSGGGLKTFLAISIWAGCSDQAPTQPSRKAARNWVSQPSVSLMSP